MINNRYINRLRPILGSMKSFIPGSFLRKGTGGTCSARYCYGVWLRHLSILFQFGNVRGYPNTVAELGPGDSIGSGLAGLLGGAQNYFAFDVVKFTSQEQNIKIFNELIPLFKNRENIPDNKEFPNVYPRLATYKFPYASITERQLKKSLTEARIRRIRDNLTDISTSVNEDYAINFICPWFRPDIIRKESVDMIYSQAVLEHVDDLEFTYRTLYYWLKKGGSMSHQIDFTSHKITAVWNGHLSYSDFTWRLIRGQRPYLLNRQLLSTHIGLLKNTGFRVVAVIPVKGKNGLARNQLSNKYKNISEEDLTVSSAHILSKKE